MLGKTSEEFLKEMCEGIPEWISQESAGGIAESVSGWFDLAIFEETSQEILGNIEIIHDALWKAIKQEFVKEFWINFWMHL